MNTVIHSVDTTSVKSNLRIFCNFKFKSVDEEYDFFPLRTSCETQSEYVTTWN